MADRDGDAQTRQEKAPRAERNILVIGATGRTGQAVVRAAHAHADKPAVHAYARTPAKLGEAEAAACTSVTSGDARDADAIRAALHASGATDVVLATGFPNGLRPTDVRAATGAALAAALAPQPPEPVGEEAAAEATVSPRVVVVSALGAGGSRLHLGWGFGLLLSLVLFFQMRDHDGQERALRDLLDGASPPRLLIVRPTGLSNEDGDAKGAVRLLDENERVPNVWVQRADLAEWIVGQICGDGECFGRAVGVTGV